MGQLAPSEDSKVSDRKKTNLDVDHNWNIFQKTLWVYYYSQWVGIGIFLTLLYFCSTTDYTIQKLWLQLSFENLNKMNLQNVSGHYLLSMLLGMPFLFLFLTKVLKDIIRKPTFNLKDYNIFSVIKIFIFIIAGHLAGYALGGLFLCSTLYLNLSLKKT